MKEQRQGELLYLVYYSKEVDNARTAVHTIVNDYVPEVVTQIPLSETGMNEPLRLHLLAEALD